MRTLAEFNDWRQSEAAIKGHCQSEKDDRNDLTVEEKMAMYTKIEKALLLRLILTPRRRLHIKQKRKSNAMGRNE
jgi:hypothetical protein